MEIILLKINLRGKVTLRRHRRRNTRNLRFLYISGIIILMERVNILSVMVLFTKGNLNRELFVEKENLSKKINLNMKEIG